MKILHLDVETTPNKIWDFNSPTHSNRKPISHDMIIDSSSVLCFAAKWHGEKKVSFFSVHDMTEKELAQAAYDLLDEADVIVGYFSSGFDVPRLRTIIMEHNLPPPSYHVDVDLYRVIRNRFKYPCYKLDYVLRRLGIGQKVKHEGFGLWRKCIEGDEKAWRRMKRYNIGDVKPLEALYLRLLPWIPRHPNFNLYNDDGVRVCPHCNSQRSLYNNGFQYTQAGKYRRYICRDCGARSKGRTTELSKETKNSMVKPL